MPVDAKAVRATAVLARLELSPEGEERLAVQLDAVIGYMDILNGVNTDSVEPLYSPARHTAPPRKDKAEARLTVAEVTANAPAENSGFFVVPQVL